MAEQKQFRLTLNEAAVQFGANRATLSKRTKNAGELPGEDGKFSILQIHRTLATDTKTLRDEQIVEETEFTRVKSRKLANKLYASDTVDRFVQGFVSEIVQRVANWPISDAQRKEMIGELSAINTDSLIPEKAPPVAEINDEE